MGSGTRIDDKTRTRIKKIYDSEHPTLKQLADRFDLSISEVWKIVNRWERPKK